MEKDILQLIKDKKSTVIGFGVSNIPLVDFLLRHGGDVTVRDKNNKDALGEKVKEYEARGVRFITGEDYLSDMGEDIIFRSPGVRPDLPPIASALERGAVLTSEMELFLELTPAKVFAVTGSDGKTTTTTLTHLMLEAEYQKNGQGKVYVGGNIGAPLLPYVEEMTEKDIAVLELSSFQLMTMRRSPSRAVLTNLAPNHIDWHGTFEEYADAKRNIYLHEPIEELVINRENEISFNMSSEFSRPITYFSSKRDSYADIVPVGRENARAIFLRDGEIIESDGVTEKKVFDESDILLPGKHNVENYMAALAVTRGYVSAETAKKIAREFRGVEHRLELVRELDGVKYYNSSIDSNPTRTAAALSALAKKPIVICGGYDKKIPFAPLADALVCGAKAVILTGATANAIMDALLACPSYDTDALPTFFALEYDDGKQNFELAVNMAKEIAEAGDIVLLSPACASFDAFKNFMERGKYFKDIVNKF